MSFLLTGVIFLFRGLMDDDFLRELALCICAACLLMLAGGCLAALVLFFVPALLC
jgi:hypothetical protein